MKITRAHGGGGRETEKLIHDIIVEYLGNPVLNSLEDAAVIPGGEELVFSTDSFVVSPLFFPGGDIGKLAVCGTVNDIAVRGGVPGFLSLALIIEEGLDTADLEKIIKSISTECSRESIQVVCGDTKVVEKGSGDGLFINTAGIGVLRKETSLSVKNLKPGDTLLVNGSVGEHGAAILGARRELNITSDLVSDCAPLISLVDCILGTGAEVHALRDATRGGIAAVVNEMAQGSGVTAVLKEESIPVKKEVTGVCSLLGMSPFDMANEGKLVAAVSPDGANTVLEAMKNHPLGKDAARIGTVEEQGQFPAVLITSLGVRNILEMPRGELLPRIC